MFHSKSKQEMTMNRRTLLTTGLAAGAGITAAPFIIRKGIAQAGTPVTLTPWVDPLPTPPVLNPANIVSGASFDPRVTAFGAPNYHELIEAEGFHQFHRDLPATKMWLYNGTFPGPTFINRLGIPTVIRRINNLNPAHVGFGMPETSMHHHGGHQSPMDDGWPLDFITPGTYRDHLIPNIVPDNDTNEWPSTLWYHDHTIDYTASNVYRGLAGMSLHFDALDSGNENDTNPAALRLPSGAYDVPLVFRDVALNADGSLLFNQLDTRGQVGNLKTVNGKVKPYLTVQRRKYRFRLLAGSMAREWMFRIWKGTTRLPFKIIASDGGLLPAPVQVTQHQMGNAERYEIIVDFSAFPAGTQITLNDHLIQTDGNKPVGVSPTGDPVLLFVVEGAAAAPDPSRVPTVLRPLSPVDMTRVVATRSLVLSQAGGIWTINGLPWNPNVPLFQPKLGSAEIWNVSVKGGGWDHPLHIHQEFFRILKRGGSTPQPWERGRKDVVLLSNTTSCQLYVQFRTFTGPYVFHCHNLGHEDMAMMGWYNVIP